MQIEAGKIYRDGKGDLHGPMKESKLKPGKYFIDQHGGGPWNENGSMWGHIPASTAHLVSEEVKP